MWWGDYCVEGELTRRLNVAGCPNVVKVHDWVKSADPDPNDREEPGYRFKILYDYYDHGSLEDVPLFYLERKYD
jgi:hypothetical protein